MQNSYGSMTVLVENEGVCLEGYQRVGMVRNGGWECVGGGG